MHRRRRNNRFYFALALVLIGVMALLKYTSIGSKILASTPSEGNNSQVDIKPINLFSDELGTPSGEVNITVARGTKESFEVVLNNRSGQIFNNISIVKQDLIGSAGDKIPRDNIDERVVHTWQQRIIIPGSSFKFNTYRLGDVEELLVKNDKEDFLSGSIGLLQDSLLSSSGSLQSSSSDSSLEPVSMKLAANSNRKFIFSINVPSTGSGDYSGDISFVDTIQNTKIKTFKLRVKVLGVDLVSGQNTNKTFGCFSNDKIPKDRDNSGIFVDAQAYAYIMLHRMQSN